MSSVDKKRDFLDSMTFHGKKEKKINLQVLFRLLFNTLNQNREKINSRSKTLKHNKVGKNEVPGRSGL